MLLLMFRAGESSYALDARRVVEVVPRVKLRPIPHAPAFLLGMLAYRGRAVPVIDFGVLTGGEAADPGVLSTRVLLTEFTGHDRQTRQVGIAAGDVSHVGNVDSGQVAPSATGLDTSP